ncbi:MAG: hypothetical protein GQ532_07615 [Methylomarinum sp.]|nr:hypothetical protein [Methylomarinum sp.]
MKITVLRSVLIVALMMLTACSSIMPKKTSEQVQVAEKVLLVSGYAQIQNQPQLTAKQNRFAIEQAAKIKAYRALADLLYSENLNNGLLVADQVIKDESFRIYADLFLREAKVVGFQKIMDQQKVLLKLHLTPRFYHCISSTVEIVSQCLQEDGKTLFTRIGYQQAEMETVNVSCPECFASLSVSGFSKEKNEVDRAMLDYGFYDSEGMINLTVRTMLNYIGLTQIIFK